MGADQSDCGGFNDENNKPNREFQAGLNQEQVRRQRENNLLSLRRKDRENKLENKRKILTKTNQIEQYQQSDKTNTIKMEQELPQYIESKGDLFGPDEIRNQFNRNNPNGSRPPLVPPNARFDPYGPDGMPPNPENNKPKNLEPNNNMQMMVQSDYCQSNEKRVEFLKGQPLGTPRKFKINSPEFYRADMNLCCTFGNWSDFVNFFSKFSEEEKMPPFVIKEMKFSEAAAEYSKSLKYKTEIIYEGPGMFSVLRIIAIKREKNGEIAFAFRRGTDYALSRCYQRFNKAPKSLTHQ